MIPVIGHPQLMLEFQRRHRVLALGQKIDRQKPGGEGKLRPCEDRSGRERSLMVTGMALIPPDRQLLPGLFSIHFEGFPLLDHDKSCAGGSAGIGCCCRWNASSPSSPASCEQKHCSQDDPSKDGVLSIRLHKGLLAKTGKRR